MEEGGEDNLLMQVDTGEKAMEQINQKIKEEYLKKKVEKLKRKINEESPE